MCSCTYSLCSCTCSMYCFTYSVFLYLFCLFSCLFCVFLYLFYVYLHLFYAFLCLFCVFLDLFCVLVSVLCVLVHVICVLGPALGVLVRVLSFPAPDQCVLVHFICVLVSVLCVFVPVLYVFVLILSVVVLALYLVSEPPVDIPIDVLMSPVRTLTGVVVQVWRTLTTVSIRVLSCSVIGWQHIWRATNTVLDWRSGSQTQRWHGSTFKSASSRWLVHFSLKNLTDLFSLRSFHEQKNNLEAAHGWSPPALLILCNLLYIYFI